jgi:cellulose synthase/poly-beta-1,6-N-acetylglucosamine synthase-like glycosyltransferase
MGEAHHVKVEGCADRLAAPGPPADMLLITLGLVAILAWPMLNAALVAYTMRDRASAVRRRRRDADPPTGHEPTEFWIVVPCLNEERVVGRTVESALALTGPLGSTTRVLVVDDGSDDGTLDVLAGIDHPNLYVLRREAEVVRQLKHAREPELPDARQGKGEALNAAYRLISDWASAHGIEPGRVAIGVIDGDGRGSPNMLEAISRAMRDPAVGAIQCRVRIHNRHQLLGAIQDLEFASIANASQLLRNATGSVGLGGNGQFTRLSALRELGASPWSKCLVEDLELGLRMHLNGVRIRYLPNASVTQQGLVDVRRLLRQRTRWAQGNLQCAVYVPRLMASRRIRNHALLEMMYYLLAPWLNAFGVVAVAGLWGYAGWRLLPGHGPTFMIHSWRQFGGILGVCAAALVLPHIVWAVLHRLHLRDERFARCLLAAVAYPGFLLLGLVSTWRAIGRQVSRRQTWAKTERLADEPAEGVQSAEGAQPAMATG